MFGNLGPHCTFKNYLFLNYRKACDDGSLFRSLVTWMFLFMFQALGIVTKLESKSKIFLKLHGSFMIASWIFAGSLGIFLARYYKQVKTIGDHSKKTLLKFDSQFTSPPPPPGFILPKFYPFGPLFNPNYEVIKFVIWKRHYTHNLYNFINKL